MGSIDRRLVLKGMGVSMALPWLESVPVYAGDQATKTAVARAPQRFACLFVGDGVSTENWWVKGQGREMELGPSLTALEPLKEKLNVIDGLYNKTAGGPHARSAANILSGAALSRGRMIRAGVTMDQVLARHFEEETVVPSLVLGCEHPVSGYHETQYSMVYASHISWENPNAPIPIELFPALAFDNLFENKSSQLQRSILDRVLKQANDLRAQISRCDQVKLDEYLHSVRDVEKRLEKGSKHNDLPEHQTAANRTKEQRPPEGLPQNLPEHARLMCDIIALAFQTDRTRVATLVLARDLSGQTYPFMNIRDDHHGLSHSCNSANYKAITKFYLDQYAYLVDKLDKMQEGEGTVLDNSCIMYINEHWDTHNTSRVPLILSGSMGGTLKTGRALDYLKAGDEKRRLCNLYLSLMDRMGVKLNTFGDATERLVDL